MYKNLLILFVLALGLSSCQKNGNKSACGTQLCDASFAFIGVHFVSNDGSPVEITDVKVINQRTNKQLELPPPPETFVYAPGFIYVASDNNKADFSSGGDEVKVTAKSAATGQIKTFTLKISGGCNCHVAKVSGDETLKFD